MGERDTEWPEFVFVRARDGAGWVPARHLSQASGRTVLQTAYDTTQLPTEVGEEVEVLAEDGVSGWLWCRSGTGAAGWIPARTVAENR